jgi:tetratricopeptide (TPR) repeat protein
MISKGQLQIAKETLEKFKNEINSKDIYASKEAQILFYLNNWEILNEKNKTYLKKNIKENPYYNDILKITNNIMLFDGDNNSLEKYSKSLLKLFQNKRTESLEIMSSLKNHSNVEIASKIKYEYSHILLSQGNIEEALETIDQIDTDSAYNESAILLKAEIYDYILNDISKAVNVYLYFLDKFPDSIHYDTIRLRLRGLTS